MQLLSSIPRLHNWELGKVEKLWYWLEERKLSKGILYDQGAPTNGVYIVKSGKLEAHSIIEVDNFRQYPISQSQWEIERITHSVKCLMGVLSKGSIFGHFEIIAKSKIRMNRISAIEDTIVLYLAESHFKEWFNENDISDLLVNSELKHAKQAVNEIIDNQKWTSFKKRAVINAAKTLNKKPSNSFDFISQNYEIDKFLNKVRVFKFK